MVPTYTAHTPSSDLDIKGLYIPVAKDILLQRVHPIISFKRPKVHGEKNTPEDVDYELYSPERFLSLLAEGQTMALEYAIRPSKRYAYGTAPAMERDKTVGTQTAYQAGWLLRSLLQAASA